MVPALDGERRQLLVVARWRDDESGSLGPRRVGGEADGGVGCGWQWWRQLGCGGGGSVAATQWRRQRGGVGSGGSMVVAAAVR